MKVKRMSYSVIAVCAIMLIACVLTAYPATNAYAADVAEGWAEGTYTELNYGIYWYGADSNVPVKAGTDGATFDASKPTFIFAHGNKNNEGYVARDVLTLWGNTNDLFKSYGHEEFEYSEDFYKKYLEMGYNVGHFYWTQFADDDLGCDIKIWSTSSDTYGMRYYVRGEDGNRVLGDASLNPTKSVAQLFGDAIVEALGEDYNQSLQIAGHSMGGQLVLATAEYLVNRAKAGEIEDNVVPDRVTLLDPYFGITIANSKINHLNFEEGNGRSLAELSANAMETAADYGIAIDAYSANVQFISRLFILAVDDEKVSPILEKLTKNCAWVYLDALQAEYSILNTHCMVMDYYYSTLYENAVFDRAGNAVPYANSAVETIKSLMGCAYSQRNVSGNPFYMKNSTYVRVDIDCEEIEDFVELGTIYGEFSAGSAVNKVYLQNSDGKTVDTASLSTAGAYRFSNLAAGTYTLTAYDAEGKEIALTDNTVNLTADAVAVVKPEIKAESRTWLYVLAGVVGVLALGTAVFFIVREAKLTNKYGKNKEE